MEIAARGTEWEFNSLAQRFAMVFPGEPGFKMGKKYLKGLIGTAERKNGWQLAEAMGEATPYATQQFLYRSRFSADALRDVCRAYVSDHLGTEDGVLIPDETGFLKQGKMSCGVKRQYSGTAGRVENCQIGVFVSYASEKGHAPIDRRLYIPEEWSKDKMRRKKAGIPEELTFQTKPQMALEMIREATEAGVPYQWVSGDCVYGDNRAIRQWLEEARKCYVLCVSGKEHLPYEGENVPVSLILKGLDENGWFEASCGDGSKGPRFYDWRMLEINLPVQEGWKRFLLVRRSKKDPEELRAYLCFAPVETPGEKFVQIAGIRWTVETCFKESKSEVGMDHYEVQSYNGWYKHITFACLALALLTVLSIHSLDGKSLQQHNPSDKSLDAFKKGRNLHV